METSDSECFESADEDFEFDQEKTKVTVKKQVDKCIVDSGGGDTSSSSSTKKNEIDEEITTKSTENKLKSNEPKVSKIKPKLGKKLVVDTSNKITEEVATPIASALDDLILDDEIDWGKEELLNQQQQPDISGDGDKNQQQQTILHEEEKSDDGWGTWSSWGVSTILNTATQSVSTLTQGISSVIETGIGVPDPAELAKINKEQQLLDETEQQSSRGFGLGNLGDFMSGVTKLVESTGTKVISGGLDTLETIGKKTMEVLQEGDPGLKKKRAFLKLDQDKPILSQVLREAKERSEAESNRNNAVHMKMRNYETLFDDHQGLVHLEALEMLSKQCEIKLQTISESLVGDSLAEMQETMDQVKELCEIPDEDEDEQSVDEIKGKLVTAVEEIHIPITYERLIDTWKDTELWLDNLKLNVCDEHELHQQAIETLAQLTSIAVEQYHKAGELLLVKEHRSTADEADSLVQLTTSLTSLIGYVAGKFSEKLNAKASQCSNKDYVNGLITNVFLEAANSSTYIQDAFQLLIPVLQVGAI